MRYMNLKLRHSITIAVEVKRNPAGVPVSADFHGRWVPVHSNALGHYINVQGLRNRLTEEAA